MLLQETLPAVFSTRTRAVIIFIQLIYIYAIATFDIVSHCNSQTNWFPSVRLDWQQYQGWSRYNADFWPAILSFLAVAMAR